MRIDRLLFMACGIFLSATALCAQVKPLETPWRGAGKVPCVGSDGGVVNCPPAPGAMAVRAGRMFDSNTGQMLTNQVILLFGHGGCIPCCPGRSCQAPAVRVISSTSIFESCADTVGAKRLRRGRLRERLHAEVSPLLVKAG